MSFSFYSTYLVLWIICLLQGLLVLGLLHQLAELRKRVEQGSLIGEERLSIGTRAPDFSVSNSDGEEIDTRVFEGRGGAVLFLSTGCSVCQKLVAGLRKSWHKNRPAVISLCHGTADDCRSYAQQLAPNVFVSCEKSNDIAERYKVYDFPTLVVLDQERRIRAYTHPQRVDDIKTLLENTLSSSKPDRAVESDTLAYLGEAP